MMSQAQSDAWRALVMATHDLGEALDRQSRRDGGLPHSHYTVLVLLYEAGRDGIPMSELAQQLRYSPSRLAHALSSLERSGWAERAPSARDRRVNLARITMAGRAVVRAVTPGQVRDVREPVLATLSAAELASLTALSHAISRATRGAEN